MTEQKETYQPERDRVFDEFSPKNLFLNVRDAGNYLLSKWLLILLFAFVTGSVAAILSNLKKSKYTAEITFALDEGATQNSKSEFAQISEQFGVGSVMDAGGVFSSVANILELMQSRLLIEKTLRSEITIDGKSIIFADFFLDSLNYRTEFMNENPYKNIDFLEVSKDKKQMIFENRIIRDIYEVLITKCIKVDSKGKGTSIVSVTCVSENELFSKYFLEALFDKVTSYYVDIKTQRAKEIVAFLQKRTDSVKNAFSGSLYSRAAIVDANINQVRQVENVSNEKKQAEGQILKNTYTDLYKSLESSKTTLMRETPLIQYIDLPMLPLKRNEPGIMKRFIIFFLIGGVFTTVFLLLRKTYQTIVYS